MRILQLHNRYQQAGGEDVVVGAEHDLLVDRGHDVRLLQADNAEIDSFVARLRTSFGVVYSRRGRRRLADAIARFRPDVVHVHNFFPLFSPAVYYACRTAGVPVVQTLHNYRLLCANSLLFRDGHVCEECVGRSFAWPAIAHACYRGSRAGTASIAIMQASHRIARTWQERVDLYIALTEFSRAKLVEGGLPADKIVVKPNFASRDIATGNGRGGYALFVGRLSPEKGLDVLLEAWKRMRMSIPLRIVGDGPLAGRVREAAGESVSYLGPREKSEVLGLMQSASLLILPSMWYEGFPMVIVEAFQVGLPVVASDLGSLSSLVTPGRTGLLFRPGDPSALAERVEWAFAHPEELSRMRRQARAEHEANYTPERNYELLMQIYDRVINKTNARQEDLEEVAVSS